MTRDELMICAVVNKDVFCDFNTGKIYGTRGGGGVKLQSPRELGFQSPDGYICVNLSADGEKMQVKAHRLIYIAAYGAIPEGMVIDHINGKKDDNRLCNLQLMTPEGNSRKAAIYGEYPSGKDNHATKISAEIRTQIVFDYAENKTSYRKLAEKYGISKSRVGQIINETGWTEYGHDGKPISDTARYIGIGNSVAIPCVEFIFAGIMAVLNEKD